MKIMMIVVLFLSGCVTTRQRIDVSVESRETVELGRRSSSDSRPVVRVGYSLDIQQGQ